ncbi:hypothetical protein ACFQFS_11675, partial [Novosphingobium lubricantis]
PNQAAQAQRWGSPAQGGPRTALTDQRQPDRVKVIGCKANVEPDYGREWVASVGGFDFGVGREGERLLDDLRSQGLIDRFNALVPFNVFDSLGQDSACFVP